MPKIVAIQMDAVETLKPQTDTTLLLGQEATRRGYEVWHYHANDLTFNKGEITARARPVTLRAGVNDHFTAGEWRTLNLRETAAVLMRQVPPFDMSYITATYLLEMLAPIPVVNDPAAVRNAPEKLMLLKEFSQFIAPTLVTRDAAAIEAFYHEQKDIVLKPVYGFSGQSVFRVQPGDTNFHALLEVLLAGKEPIIAQRFISDIRTMDKRIVIIDGNITAVMGRVPAKDDIRAGFRAGGTGVKVTPTARDIEIGEAVAKELARRGIIFAGIDVIGDHLTEINVTCPTGLPKSNELYGLTQERDVWDAIEKRM